MYKKSQTSMKDLINLACDLPAKNRGVKYENTQMVRGDFHPRKLF
jgi:hypothetical protein